MLVIAKKMGENSVIQMNGKIHFNIFIQSIPDVQQLN